MPVLSKLLSLDTPSTKSFASHPNCITQEACRIGAMLYLAAVRRKFGVPLPGKIYIPKLKSAIQAWDVSGVPGSDSVLLWVLLIGCMQALRHEEYPWFVERITALISKLGCVSWDAVMALATKVLWVQGVFEIECEELHRDVSIAWWNLYRRVFP